MKTPRNENFKKVIVDYKKLNNTILDLLIDKYPDGYDEDDIIVFRNAKNEIVECVEVRTEDTIYLVKVSKRLVAAMEDHDENDDGNEDVSNSASDDISDNDFPEPNLPKAG